MCRLVIFPGFAQYSNTLQVNLALARSGIHHRLEVRHRQAGRPQPRDTSAAQAKLFGIKIWQPPIEKQRLPGTTFQMGKRFGAATCILKTSDRRTQTFEYTLPYGGTRGSYENVRGIGGRNGIVLRNRITCHVFHLKQTWLEAD
jgi:hypothetical protein